MTLTRDWLDALNREREATGEIAALRRDQARYNCERQAYARALSQPRAGPHRGRVGQEGARWPYLGIGAGRGYRPRASRGSRRIPRPQSAPAPGTPVVAGCRSVSRRASRGETHDGGRGGGALRARKRAERGMRTIRRPWKRLRPRAAGRESPRPRRDPEQEFRLRLATDRALAASSALQIPHISSISEAGFSAPVASE